MALAATMPQALLRSSAAARRTTKAQLSRGARVSAFNPSKSLSALSFRSTTQPLAARSQGSASTTRAAKRLSVTAMSGTDPDASVVLDAVGRRLVSTADTFQRVGTLSFWTSLVLSCVSFVIWIFASTFEKAHGGAHSGLFLALVGVAASFLATF